MARSSIPAGERPAAAPFGQTLRADRRGPRTLPAPRGRGHGGPDQRLPGWWSARSCRSTVRTAFFGVAVGQGVKYRPIRIAVP